MCNQEFPDLEPLYQAHRDNGFIVVGLATGGVGGLETEQTLRAFIEQTGVTSPIAWDADSFNTFAWPDAISPFPRQALIGRAGDVRYLASEYDATALSAAIEAAVAEPHP